MTGLVILLTIICFVVIFIGLLGTIIPVLPGAPLIFVAALILAVLDNFQRISVGTLVWLGVIALVSYFINLFWVARGVKKNSTSNTGLLFSGIGAVAGFLVFNFIGLFVGLIIGFIVDELVSGTLPERIPKLALNVFVSFLAGMFIQFISGLIMVGIVIFAYFL